MTDFEKAQLQLLKEIAQSLKTLNAKSEVISKTLLAIQAQKR